MLQSNKSKPNRTISNMFIEIVEEQNKSDYSHSLNNYKSSEFIPYNLIPIIMKHHFKSSELLLNYNENHGIFKIKIDDLLVDAVKNWDYNRPPDMGRCPDIARYIYLSKKPIDTMIYLCYNNLKETFEVLDGIHRITALKMIKYENSKPLDLLTDYEFGSGNDASWLFNQYIVVNIRFNSTLGEQIELFQNLNKSQNVPDLYIRDTNKEKRDAINEIANEWFVRYKRHFSSSTNPNKGNTNRNKFVELLDKLYDKHNINDSNINKLKSLLEEANYQISLKIPLKTTVDNRVKCKETGCYLFLLKNDALEKLI
jgi:hypothetical protein